MDKEFLEDYEKAEKEMRAKFVKKAIQGDFSSCRTYFLKRFHNPPSPISKMHSSIVYYVDEPIWTTTPLSGSTILTLIPSPRQNFEKDNKFKIEEIPNIVDYVKREGRIQFTLKSSPLDYAHLDFLEPIFTELRPPVLFGVPPEAYFGSKEIKKSVVEFETLAKIKIEKEILDWSVHTFGTVKQGIFLLEQFSGCYAFVKCMHYNQLIDEIQEATITDLGRLNFLMGVTYILITPLIDITKASILASTDFYRLQNQYVASHLLPTIDSLNTNFPGEIGKFLFKTLVHTVPTLDACKQLSYLYEDLDVYKAGQALNEAVVANKPDVVKDKSIEVSTILQDIWEDKGLQRKIMGVKAGVTVLFAALGAVSNGLTGVGLGILASFGFDVADRLFKFGDEAISEKIGKLFSSSYEAIIYDFKKKYPITGSTKKL
jgi:hypothetical protein